jgi:hypothetical protein
VVLYSLNTWSHNIRTYKKKEHIHVTFGFILSKNFQLLQGVHIGNQTFLYKTWETLNHYLGIYEEIEYIHLKKKWETLRNYIGTSCYSFFFPQFWV